MARGFRVKDTKGWDGKKREGMHMYVIQCVACLKVTGTMVKFREIGGKQLYRHPMCSSGVAQRKVNEALTKEIPDPDKELVLEDPAS